VNSVHEYFAVTDSHSQISQHRASLKYENVTESHHSYTTLLPQNILQLQLHFSCTLYSINNLSFTKIRDNWKGWLPLHTPNFEMFLVCPNLNEVVSIGSNLNWTVAICPNIYNLSERNFKFAQVVPIVPKFE